MPHEAIALTPAGAWMLVSTQAEDHLQCPHCGEGFGLDQVVAEPDAATVACPRCSKGSLVVRIVSVLHRAVRLPGEWLMRLGTSAESLGETRAAASLAPPVRTPPGIFELPTSRGSVLLLAMMWHCAERTGSTTITSSVAELARRLLTSRAVLRRWLAELKTAGALRELTAPEERPRRWALLPLPEKEADRG